MQYKQRYQSALSLSAVNCVQTLQGLSSKIQKQKKHNSYYPLRQARVKIGAGRIIRVEVRAHHEMTENRLFIATYRPLVKIPLSRFTNYLHYILEGLSLNSFFMIRFFFYLKVKAYTLNNNS